MLHMTIIIPWLFKNKVNSIIGRNVNINNFINFVISRLKITRKNM